MMAAPSSTDLTSMLHKPNNHGTEDEMKQHGNLLLSPSLLASTIVKTQQSKNLP